MQIISFIVPVYNEAGNIERFVDKISNVCKSIERIDYEVIFALDPSSDGTEEAILKVRMKNARVKYLKFARRIGQPLATIAGLRRAAGDACIVMDVDLQDPPSLIPEMIKKWREGNDVVYATRRDRKYENFFRRILGHMYYYLLDRMSDTSIPRNTGDFRLMSRRVVEELKHMKEGHGFLRGMVAFIGFKQVPIYFDRKQRDIGDTKYPRFTGSIKIGINGLLAFSNRPLMIASYLGFVGLMASFFLLLCRVFGILFSPSDLPILSVFLFAFISLQMIAIGIVGEYVGRIYDEVKDRPLFSIDAEEGF